MVKLKLLDIKSNRQHPFALGVQMVWSKNIHEEQDAVQQIVLGSMDAHLCPLIALGLYLTVHLSSQNAYAADRSAFVVCGGKTTLPW